MATENLSADETEESCLLSPFIILPYPSNFSGITLRPRKLPAISLHLIPDLNVNSAVAVASTASLMSASLRHDMIAEIDGRKCRIYASEALAGDPNVVHDGVMLSPVLYNAWVNSSVESSTVRLCRSNDNAAAPMTTSRSSKVVAGVIAPFDFLQNASKYAEMAKEKLLGQFVSVGDVLAISLRVWIAIEAVTGDGLLTADTAFAIRATGPRTEGIVSEYMRDWAKLYWEDQLSHVDLSLAKRVELSIGLEVGLVLVQGLSGDVHNLLKVVGIGRALLSIDGRCSVKEAMDAVAKLSVLESGKGIIVCNGMLGVNDDIAELLIRETYTETAESYLHVESIGHEAKEKSVQVVLLCSDTRDLDEALVRSCGHEIHVQPANMQERADIIRNVLSKSSEVLQSPEVEDAKHINTAVDSLTRMSVGFSRQEVSGLASVFSDRGMEGAEEAVKLYGKGQVVIDTGDITWEDIGGLEEAKRQINELVSLRRGTMVSHDDKASSKDKSVGEGHRSVGRTGILLYGPPGTGKTLLARAMAGETGCSFMSVKGPELLDMYVGESEHNVRAVFANAIAAAPCVIFFDELDALVPARGRGSDSGGVSDRVVSQMMAELDTVHQRGDIYVVGASNRPDLVDASLLRPGRFDKLVYVPMPETREAQKVVLKAQTRKFTFDGPVNFYEILDHVPPPPALSGADLYALSADAWLRALKRTSNTFLGERNAAHPDVDLWNIEKNRLALWENVDDAMERWADDSLGYLSDELNSRRKEPKSSEFKVPVSQEDFINAAKHVSPSLSAHEGRQYEQLRSKFETQ